MFGWAVAIALAAQQGGPPSSAAACFNGSCIVESWPRSPYIVFFVDGQNALDAEGGKLLAEFADQSRWWPHLRVEICAPAQDKRNGARLRGLERELAAAGYRHVTVRREGRKCAINGGANRSAGYLAYQLELLP
jgi:hypothetical protein